MASYRVEVTREVRSEIRGLPGNVRQRAIRALRFQSTTLLINLVLPFVHFERSTISISEHAAPGGRGLKIL